MAFIVKALGAGSVTATGTVDGYVVPDNRSAMVTSVRMVNDNPIGPVPSMALSVRAAGKFYNLMVTKSAAVTTTTMLVAEGPFTLGAGDKLRLHLSGSTGTYDLQYSIFGVERD